MVMRSQTAKAGLRIRMNPGLPVLTGIALEGTWRAPSQITMN